MKLIDSKTYHNLAKAYAGECQAMVRYKFIEYGARMAGYSTLSELVDTVAYQEFNHARMLYTFIESATDDVIDNIDICSGYPFREKWDLVENLRLAAVDEDMAISHDYPEYEKVAKKEGFDDIAGLFHNLIIAENEHKKLFTNLYEQLKSGTLYKKEQETTWKCSGCGYVEKGKKAFKTCPLCQAKQGVVSVKIPCPADAMC